MQMQSQPIGFSGGKTHENGVAGTSPTQRKFLDIVDLSSNGFDVMIAQDDVHDIYVKLHVDPVKYPQLNVSKELCPYLGGVWWLHIELPDRYPQASPSVGFVNRIFHPNVEEQSGSICLDVLNQTWSPMFTLTHTLSNFLTQLLQYPNPHDPMNGEAAALLIQSEDRFREKVQTHTQTHATEEKAAAAIKAETQGREFYTPDVDAKKKKRAAAAGTPSADAPISTPGTEGSSGEQKKDEDDVSSASDIDLD
eukprot:TRINITY_DN30753_c0_g1_i1.p1 TRINITY_DN30753_c0_g1~~TRINITY_DN30753_c0_g1_i1.p1  ORF type:complete len:251 (+),score=56.15 TRINITY_DN30753_c0_g1_i1:79-831(+)